MVRRKYKPPAPRMYEPGYVTPFTAAFEAWINDHEPVPADMVFKQLQRIPVGRHGVAGVRGSSWDNHLWSPYGDGHAVGPGVAVKRLEDDLFLVGCTRPYLSAVGAVAKIVALYIGTVCREDVLWHSVKHEH